jgi:hypothetical protein
MAIKVSGAKYLPLLGALLLLLLLAGLGLIAGGFGGQSRGGNASSGFDSLLKGQAALLAARQALAGDAEVLESLSSISQQLKSANTGGLSQDQTAAMLSLGASLETINNGRDALTTLSRAGEDLDVLLRELQESSNVLENAIVVQRQPIVVAQLNRLHLLGEGLRRDIAGLSFGAGEPGDLTQPLPDS